MIDQRRLNKLILAFLAEKKCSAPTKEGTEQNGGSKGQFASKGHWLRVRCVPQGCDWKGELALSGKSMDSKKNTSECTLLYLNLEINMDLGGRGRVHNFQES